MNIILDMDQTLIDGFYINKNMCAVYQRPFLKKFFTYIFNKFKNVSIWTHATTEWYNYCYNKILKHSIPKGKKFFTVITRDNGILPFRIDMAKVLDQFIKIYPSHNRKNTIIIDDKQHTFKYNIENAIHIKPFTPITDPITFNNTNILINILTQNKNMPHNIDIELLKIIKYFENKIK